MKHALLAPLALLALLAAPAAHAQPEPLDGWAITPYTGGMTALRCHPLGACVVRLEPGEVPGEALLSDTALWQYDTVAGPGGASLLAVKPRRCAISASLVVPTDRRVYQFLLESPGCEDEPVPPAAALVSTFLFFTYPAAEASLWATPRLAPPPAPGPEPLATTATATTLDTNYRWRARRRSGDLRLVYTDGERTYIALADKKLGLPVAFLPTKEGLMQVPYSAHEDTLVVEGTPEKILLAFGPRRDQRTTISRQGR
jgi:type IV secretory pathway VirB9-like protein